MTKEYFGLVAERLNLVSISAKAGVVFGTNGSLVLAAVLALNAENKIEDSRKEVCEEIIDDVIQQVTNCPTSHALFQGSEEVADDLFVFVARHLIDVAQRGQSSILRFCC